MGRIEKRRADRGIGLWGLCAGGLVLVLSTGCEMAGGRAADGMLSEIPGTAVQEAPPVGGERSSESQPVVASGVEIAESTALAIQDAAIAYVRDATAIQDIRVEIDAVADGWVRARALPAGEETDPATLYLREDANGWRGVAIGTAFTPEDLDDMGIPSAVRPQE